MSAPICIRIIVLLICSVCFIGCSDGANSVVPTASSDSQSETFNGLAIGVSDYSPNGNPMAGSGALGLFEIHVDIRTLEGEITPFRTTALTDVLEIVDITTFLQSAPCTDCVKLRSISLDSDENLVLSIGIRHPFDANPGGPSMPTSRIDLHVFNVEGTIIATTNYVDIFGCQYNQ